MRQGCDWKQLNRYILYGNYMSIYIGEPQGNSQGNSQELHEPPRSIPGILRKIQVYVKFELKPFMMLKPMNLNVSEIQTRC